ncbi:MAG: DUF499 domain-containing protein, partial [Sulfolobus sp.]|nr:DUF499 domain-containing protein [Sulfolobus sp.]
MELLRDKNVVFLFDEVIHRLSSWWHNERLEKYALSIVNFLLDFANAIVKTESVLIFSIPADIKERKIENVDKVYEEVIYAVYDRLNRHDALIVPPMDIRTDVTQVLKKRIFEYVDENTAREIANRYSQLAKHFPDFDNNFIDNIVNTYPFNPNYLSTLLIITNKNTDIQKTRGLIKLTRVLVRWLWNHKLNEKLSMISPSDFEISDPEIKPSLITPSFKEFDLVVQRVSESLRNLYGSNQKTFEIAKRIAYYILISTYVYKLGIRASGDFPTSKEVIQAVYDMLLFDSLKARPNEIEDILSQVSKDPLLKVSYIYTDDIHYWVTSMPGYEEYIAKLAGEIKDPEAWEEVKRMTEDLIKEQLKSKESLRFHLHQTVYDLDLGDFDIPDEKKYTIVLALTRLSNFPDMYKLEKVILKDKSGNYRKYLNTVVLLYPNRSERDIEDLKNNIKRLIAYEKFRAEDIYPQSDKDLIDFINRKVKEARDYLEDKVIIDVQRFYNYVAFPDVGEGNQIKVT